MKYLMLSTIAVLLFVNSASGLLCYNGGTTGVNVTEVECTGKPERCLLFTHGDSRHVTQSCLTPLWRSRYGEAVGCTTNKEYHEICICATDLCNSPENKKNGSTQFNSKALFTTFFLGIALHLLRY